MLKARRLTSVTLESPGAFELQCGAHLLKLGPRTLIMGILNVTPDSFSDGGLFFDIDDAIDHGVAMAEAGADILDVGGESTRPFSEPVSPEEELRRVVPVIEGLGRRLSVPVSIDTTKAEVARAALDAGAVIVNDVGALRLDPEMAGLIAARNVSVVLMHMQGLPKTMQLDSHYQDVVGEVKTFLADAVDGAEAAGINRSKIIVDPGIGFGKTVTHNLILIQGLPALQSLGVPVLIGPSRKSFITKLLGEGDDRRELGTQAAVSAAVLNGAHIVRVHDVARTKETLKLIDAIKNVQTNGR
ncbi:MAG: dihydropteroate synthase [Deltaproteobacteria bacterium]|nr:dihydropteroate synthase [Deltaproteobacteria bacterium]